MSLSEIHYIYDCAIMGTHCVDTSTPDLKGAERTACVTRMITVAIVAEYSRSIKEWVQCCVMFSDTETFTERNRKEGKGATHGTMAEELSFETEWSSTRRMSGFVRCNCVSIESRAERNSCAHLTGEGRE